jgi:hypothetical protein
MLPRWLLDLGIPEFNGWTIPVAGVLAAGLAFVTGSLFFGRRNGSAKPALAPPTAAPSPPSAPTDRRTSHRREGTDVEVLISDAEVKTTPVQGWVIDRSLGGVCLRAPTSFPVGAILSLRPCSAPSVAPWVQVEVKSCRQMVDAWEVGCQFLRTPPYSVLLLFG